MLDNIDRIEQHVAGMTREEFIVDLKTMDAVQRCLARISEAAVKLDRRAETQAPDEEWDNIRGLGHHLPHGYDNINPERIWLVVEDRRPGLRLACQHALKLL